MNKYILVGAVLLSVLASTVLLLSGATPVSAIICGLTMGVLAVSGTAARWVEGRVPRGHRPERRDRAAWRRKPVV